MTQPSFAELQLHALTAERMIMGLPYYQTMEEIFPRLPVLQATLSDLHDAIDLLEEHPELAPHMTFGDEQ